MFQVRSINFPFSAHKVPDLLFLTMNTTVTDFTDKKCTLLISFHSLISLAGTTPRSGSSSNLSAVLTPRTTSQTNIAIHAQSGATTPRSSSASNLVAQTASPTTPRSTSSPSLPKNANTSGSKFFFFFKLLSNEFQAN